MDSVDTVDTTASPQRPRPRLLQRLEFALFNGYNSAQPRSPCSEDPLIGDLARVTLTPTSPIVDIIEAPLLLDEEPQEPLNVVVKKSTFAFCQPDYDTYLLSRSPRGIALIINNNTFHTGCFNERKGSQVDVKNLTTLFDQLGYKVVLEENLTAHEIRITIDEFTANPLHYTYQSCIVAILSHGVPKCSPNGCGTGIVGVDGESVGVEYILSRFSNRNCPSLSEKPKMFFIQACRGDDVNIAVSRSTLPNRTQGDSGAQRSGEAHIMDLPAVSDMFIAHATIPGYVAHRDIYRGSWFVEAICDVFMEYAHNHDLADLMRLVMARMKFFTTQYNYTQTVEWSCRGTSHKVYFNPGMDTEPGTQQRRNGPI